MSRRMNQSGGNAAQSFVYHQPQTAGTEPSSSRGTFNPLAYFSTVTLSEHDEVQRQLDGVRRSAAVKARELDDATREHQRRAELALSELDRQESVLRGDLISIRNVIAALSNSVDREFARDNADAHDFSEEKAALAAELESLAMLEEDMKRLRDNVSTSSTHVSIKKADFVVQSERFVADMSRARQEAARMGYEVSRHLNQSPVRDDRVSTRRSPPRDEPPARSPVNVRPANLSFVAPRPPSLNTSTASAAGPKSPVTSRYLSPPRRASPPKAVAVAVSPPRMRDTTASPARVSPGRGRGAGGEGITLHALCAKGLVAEALAILRNRPEVINELDSDANTPLHAACGSPHISLELVNALLVAGSSTNAKNDDGHSAFHVACLNTADHATHSLKKLLLFKAGVNPNQRTSRGETAAHLCARHDRNLESLKYLAGTGCDLHISALTTADDDAYDPSTSIGSPRRMTPLEVAQRCGVRARRSADVLKAASTQGNGSISAA